MSGKSNPKNTPLTSVAKPNSSSIGHNSDDQTKKDMYVNSYREHQKSERLHFLEMCKVVQEARTVLSQTMFEEFCKEVGLARNSSMYRKAKIVADAADRLTTLGERLPEAKSTLYELAAADENVFSELAASKERITAERVRAARAPNPAKQEQCKFSVDATTLRHGERLTLLRAIKEEASKTGAKVTFPKSLQMEEARP